MTNPKVKVREIFTLILEIEVFDLCENACENEERAACRYGTGIDYKNFNAKEWMKKWIKDVENNHPVFRWDFPKVLYSHNFSRYNFSERTFQIQAERKFVAKKYSKKDNSAVELEYCNDFWPTEQQLVRIMTLDMEVDQPDIEGDKSEAMNALFYNSQRDVPGVLGPKVFPLLNRISILHEKYEVKQVMIDGVVQEET